MTGRRSFLMGCGVVVASPVFAHLALPAGTMRDARESTTMHTTAPPQSIALRVAGWDAESDSDRDVFVHISSSWRANWR